MADKTYKLTFKLSDGTEKQLEFVSPQGEPGVSPTITTHSGPLLTQVVIKDVNGTQTFDIPNGKNGVSPTIEITEITGGNRVTVTDANGSKSFDVMDGAKGDKGDEGDSPTLQIPVNQITGGHEVIFVVNGEVISSFQVMDGKDGKDAEGGGGSSGGVSSWNDLKDRPFYDYNFTGYIFKSESTVPDIIGIFADHREYGFTESALAAPIVPGSSYALDIDGLEGSFIAQQVELEGVEYVALGNVDVLLGGTLTDFAGINTFAVITDPNGESIGEVNGKPYYAKIFSFVNAPISTVSVYGTSIGVKKIPEKYLPDDIGGSELTDLETIALLADNDMLPTITDSNGRILTDANNTIMLRY